MECVLTSREDIIIDDLSDYFPTGFTPKSYQQDILDDLSENLKSYNHAIIPAPTGIGKSLIAMSISEAYGPSYITTNTIALQKQYKKTFDDVFVMTGTNNHECIKTTGDYSTKGQLITLEDLRERKETCASGKCYTINKFGVEEWCSHRYGKSYNETTHETDSCKLCYYYHAKDTMKKYKIVVINTSLYFSYKTYDKNFRERSTTIYDEAHLLEDKIRSFIGLSINKTMLKYAEIKIENFNVGDKTNHKRSIENNNITGVLDLLKSLKESFYYKIEEYKEWIKSYKTNTELSSFFGDNKTPTHLEYIHQHYAKFENYYNKITRVYDVLKENPSNFIHKQNDKNYLEKGLELIPIDVSPYTKKFLNQEHMIFMSATMDPIMHCKTLGLDYEKFYIPTEIKSPFLSRNRQVKFENITELRYKSTDYEKQSMVDKIIEILNHPKHQNQRGLILTSSIGYCNFILDNLPPSLRDRIITYHAKNNAGKKTPEEVLEIHNNKENSVLLSSSAWNGLDLNDEKSRFQIIHKYPLMPFLDRFVNFRVTKTLGGDEWYNYDAIIKFLQGIGRSIRNENDYAVTYVLDTTIQQRLKQYRHIVPTSFHDILGIEKK